MLWRCFNNHPSRRNLDISGSAEILLIRGFLGSHCNRRSQHAIYLALGCGEVSASPEQFGVASTSKSNRIVCTCRELCPVACSAASGVESRLASLCDRHGDTSADHCWWCLDSCDRSAGWTRWSSAAHTLHSSDFNRYSAVLVCNDSAVESILMFLQVTLSGDYRL